MQHNINCILNCTVDGLLFAIIFSLCNSSRKKTSDNSFLFQQLPALQTGISFTNTITDTKDLNIFTYHNFYNGGGVAIGDVNNDGRPDIFFTLNQQQCK